LNQYFGHGQGHAARVAALIPQHSRTNEAIHESNDPHEIGKGFEFSPGHAFALIELLEASD
jgi:hypothetical protein